MDIAHGILEIFKALVIASALIVLLAFAMYGTIVFVLWLATKLFE